MISLRQAFGLSVAATALAASIACDSEQVAKDESPPSKFYSELDPEYVRVLESHGDAVTFADWKEHYAKQEPDSTPLYTKAHSLLPPNITEELNLRKTKDPETGEAQSRRLVKEHQEPLALLDQALSMKRPAWDIQGDLGFSDPEEILWMFDLGMLLSERARVKMLDGDLDGFLDDFQKLDLIANHMVEYKTYNGASSHSNVGRRALLTDLLTRYKDDRAALEKIEAAFEARSKVPSPFEFLHGKAADCVFLVEDEERLKERLEQEFSDDPAFLQRQIDAGILEHSTRLAAANECVRRSAEMWLTADRLKSRRYYFAEVQDEFYLHHLEMFQDVNPVAELVLTLMSTPFEEHQHTSNIYVRNNIGLVVIRLALMRLENGQWPDELPDWGELTQDPFSDGKLIYKRTNPGILIYSVGFDLDDDGGAGMTQELQGDLTTRISFD